MSKPEKGAEAVKVVVRCRPLNSKEKGDNRAVIVEMDTDAGSIKVNNPKADGEAPKTFTFDQVYDMTCHQRDIFDITARPIIDSCVEGYNGTIFAYGQTGTGKSFTMEGVFDNPDLKGIIPNTFDYVFQVIAKQGGSKEFLVRASYLEIYNEDIRDLLSKTPDTKLELKETPDKGVYVKDLMQFVVKSVAEITNVLGVGKKNRSVGATQMNADSSRSHSIFTITIEVVEKLTAGNAKDEAHIRVGKCNLVDLAGSERQSKTGATGDRLKEGIKINQSLSALGNVISALVDGKSGHVPYRDSKLTRLLQDSLGGNTKTVMVANIGPADWNFDETMSTLRYANRAKNIKNKPRINEDPKDAMLREFQDEINRLKNELAARGGGGGGGGGGVRIKEVERVVEVEDDVSAVREKLKKELEEKMRADLSKEAVEKAKKEASDQARKALETIAADGNKTEAQRKKARDALRKQHAEMEAIAGAITKDQEEKEALERKIKEWESKVLQGGVNLFDKVDELKKRSEDTKRELQIQKRQEAEQKRRLAEMEAEKMQSQDKFSSLEEEVQVKGKQLKKLFEKYQAKKAETNGLQEQFQREREGLLEDYRILTQQIKLKNLIIACFIPPDYQDSIMQHCHWQDYDSAWNIDGISYAGNTIRAQQELQAQEARDAADSDIDKLAHVYFTYAEGEEGGGIVNAAAARGKAASGGGAKSPKKAMGKGKDPTNIGGLKDAVHYGGQDDGKGEKAFPKARGIVKDTIDPRLRKSVAK